METIDKAEQVINSLKRDNRLLKANQIRKFLSAVNTLANKIAVYKAKYPNKRELDSTLLAEVRYLDVMLVYQIGRDEADKSNRIKTVKEFVKRAELRDWIKKTVTDVKSFEKFNRYVEALVAYHKFYGGRE